MEQVSYSVHDVAAYILEKCGPMTTKKLQKLVYYAQAWSLAIDDRPLFDATIKAWVDGPVVTDLFCIHKGSKTVFSWMRGSAGRVPDCVRPTMDRVLLRYGPLSPEVLVELTHSELPWKQARNGLKHTDHGRNRISPETMRDYYRRLAGQEGIPVAPTERLTHYQKVMDIVKRQSVRYHDAMVELAK